MRTTTARLSAAVASAMLFAAVFGSPVLGASAPHKGAPQGSRTITDPPDATGPLDLRSVSLRAAAGRLTLGVSTTGPWALDDLARFPRGEAPYLCLQLRQNRGRSRLCLGPHRKGRAVVGLTRHGRRNSNRLVPVRLHRSSESAVQFSLPAGAAGVGAGRFGWAVGSRTQGPACAAVGTLPCADRAPADGFEHLRLQPQRPTGCTHHGPAFRTHGSRRRKLIGIGFDDGPSGFTHSVLNVLRRFNSHATFFEIGQVTAGRAAVMRRILDSGNEIGNHSLHHEAYPSSGSMAATNHDIHRATGFTPCLFRPPGGATNSALVHRARALGMTTVNWDVDPRDWSTPGTGAIASAVIRGAHKGSIIVMHDGGGPRGQTVAALPTILSHFRHRGYRFVTITELLGNHLTPRAAG